MDNLLLEFNKTVLNEITELLKHEQ